MSFVRTPAIEILSVIFLASCICFSAVCSGPGRQSVSQIPLIVVEGLVSARGNEPFTGLMLVTDDRNSYILVLPDDGSRREVQRASPGRFRVSGTPYNDQWQGRDFAHLRVTDWERLDS